MPNVAIRRLRRLVGTLKFRLAVWNAAVVLLTASVLLLALRAGVRKALLHEMDEMLEEDAQEVALMLRDEEDLTLADQKQELHRKALGHQHHRWFVQLLDSDQHLIWETPDSPHLDGTHRLDQARSPQTIGGFRVTLLSALITSTSLVNTDPNANPPHNPPAKIAWIRVGASLAPLNRDVATIDRAVLFAAAAVLIAAPLIGFFLARHAIQPIAQLTTIAARMRPERLEERLALRGTGDELDRLAETVNRLLNRIAAYVESNQAFIANAAHELRTPLAALQASVEVGMANCHTTEDYQRLIEQVLEQGQRLQVLVNQLLMVSESEAANVDHNSPIVQFGNLTQNLVDMFSGLAEVREIELKIDIDSAVQVRGYQHLLRQAVGNLLDNAIKYTDSNGRVSVCLTQDNQSARLTITDTGHGIPPEDLPHIFERFHRSDKARTRPGPTNGHGLGLSICQAVVQAHHGAIRCTSLLGEGTTMTLELPTTSKDAPA